MAATNRRGALEASLFRQGVSFAGIDEVGRGCLAGPVYAGCAVLDLQKLKRLRRPDRELIRDSKTLSASQRARIVPRLHEVCVEWHIAAASAEEIETHNIVGATFLAMRRCLTAIATPIQMLLIDGKWPLKGYSGPQQAIIKGDWYCFSIAAASILAKEARDTYMQEQAQIFPEYGFDSHVGYGTKQHLAMIRRHGICHLHRRTFEPVKPYAENASPRQPLAPSRGNSHARPASTRVADSKA